MWWFAWPGHLHKDTGLLFCFVEMCEPQFSMAEQKGGCVWEREVHRLRGLSRGLHYSSASVIYLAALRNPHPSLPCQPCSYWFVLVCCTAMYLHMVLLTLSTLFHSFLFLVPAPVWWAAIKSARRSADEPKPLSLAAHKQLSFWTHNTSGSLFNIVTCHLTESFPSA